MGIAAFEGIVEQGQIRLKANIQLPDKTRVYIVVPDLIESARPAPHIFSPRLAHPEQAGDLPIYKS